MGIQTGRMANSSYVKLFFPCCEDGADVDPLDVILAAQTAQGGTNPGDGSKFSPASAFSSTTIASGSFPTISADQSCILFTVAGGVDGTFGLWFHGDASSGQRIGYGLASTTAAIVASGGTVEITDAAMADSTNPHGYAVTRNVGGNSEWLVDGVVVGTPATAPTGTINPPTDEMVLSNADYYGYALFVFDGPLPDDYKEALAWMSPRWAVNQKVIWPAWEAK